MSFVCRNGRHTRREGERDGWLSYLEVLRELFVELEVFLTVLCDVGDHVDRLLHQVLADNAENLVLLQGFS
jgi:hypothetical protein